MVRHVKNVIANVITSRETPYETSTCPACPDCKNRCNPAGPGSKVSPCCLSSIVPRACGSPCVAKARLLWNFSQRCRDFEDGTWATRSWLCVPQVPTFSRTPSNCKTQLASAQSAEYRRGHLPNRYSFFLSFALFLSLERNYPLRVLSPNRSITLVDNFRKLHDITFIFISIFCQYNRHVCFPSDSLTNYIPKVLIIWLILLKSSSFFYRLSLKRFISWDVYVATKSICFLKTTKLREIRVDLNISSWQAIYLLSINLLFLRNTIPSWPRRSHISNTQDEWDEWENERVIEEFIREIWRWPQQGKNSRHISRWLLIKICFPYLFC